MGQQDVVFLPSRVISTPHFSNTVRSESFGTPCLESVVGGSKQGHNTYKCGWG